MARFTASRNNLALSYQEKVLNCERLCTAIIVADVVTSAPPVFWADARALATTLAWLRPCALSGQVFLLAFALTRLGLALPLIPLAGAMGLLAAASIAAFWRLRRARLVSEVEAACHAGFDMLMLAWVLYFTGGAANPFITLLLVPVALSAATLSGRSIAVVTALALALYAVLTFHSVPLSDMAMSGRGFRLHLTGMAINFAIAALLLAVFVGRMNASLRAQRALMRELRERALRDEGILAIATQAAEAAHRLNTPLSTLRTLLPELVRDHEDDAELCTDLRLMRGQVDRCRDILRTMVDYGRDQLDGTARTTTLGEYVDNHLERFRLLHPEADVRVTLAAALRERVVAIQPGLAHALLNLMQNALEASRQVGSLRVDLDVSVAHGLMQFVIGDRGNGFIVDCAALLPGASAKPNGLGIGLALARSTVERMHGTVSTHSGGDGACVRVQLPVAGSS